MEENKTIWTESEVLKGLGTTIKGKEFLPTRAYVEPFLNIMSKITSKFIFHVKTPPQLTMSLEDSSENLTFNRVWVEAVLPEDYTIEGHEEVIGLIYGIDTRIPIMKIYKAGIRSACTNLCVFNPDLLNVQQIEPEQALNYDCVKTMLEQTNTVKAFVSRLKNESVVVKDQEDKNELIGNWINRAWDTTFNRNYGKIKVSDSLVLSAVKKLFREEDSEYYCGDKNDTSLFNVYNAFTQVLTDNREKDIMNTYEKTVVVGDILNVQY